MYVLKGVKRKGKRKEIDPLEMFTICTVEQLEGREKTDVLISVKRNTCTSGL
jgi:hypothetical protein